ncbi:MAG: hypothetical protein QOH75_2 [Actinomycetota bacterium]|nr:hypothetical protein [Actinomycetota bacterium]
MAFGWARVRAGEDGLMRARTRRLATLATATTLLGPLLGSAPAWAAGGQAEPATARPCAEAVVADHVGGAAAVRELGADLPAAAANVDMTPSEYRTLLRTDDTVLVDECGETVVVEPTRAEPAAAEPDPAGAPTDAGAPEFAGLDPSGDPFALSSRPASQRTIYLDFTGERLVGTVWNRDTGNSDFVAAPFDTDGVPTSFSPAEQDTIRSVWQRVAEDYAPFDVNVTTQEPAADAITRTGVSDQAYGTRALITNDTVVYGDPAGCNSSCGGVAYIGVFDRPSSPAYYQPALIFQRGTSAKPKSLAEAASHEIGHNLGLNHDGTTTKPYYAGQGAWAPIMGVGYYLPVTQWSKGEYSNSNNTEDDLAVIAAHGAAPVADDHADAAGSATTLPVDGTLTDGLISSRQDTDWFSFTVSGAARPVTVRVTPQTVGGNLDARLDLYDAAGAPFGTDDPAAAKESADSVKGLNAGLTRTLEPGTYLAKVDGVGSGSPTATGYSDYASLGRYTIGVVDTAVPLSVATGALPAAESGAAYQADLTAVGGSGSYSWALASGSLPAGLTLSGTGTISGTPSSAGSSPVTVQVTNPDTAAAATRQLSLRVDPAPGATTSEPPAVADPPTVTAPPPVVADPVVVVPPPTVTVPGPGPTTPTVRPPTYGGTLRSAVASLTVRGEVRAGYSARRFPLVDADRDCQSTRTEVLVTETRRSAAFTGSRRCTVRTGDWFSYLDRTNIKAASGVTVTATVPLREAWESGARSWSAARRLAFANDLSDPRTLVAVSTKVAKARGGQDPTRWLPVKAARCQYVAQWVAVKVRWGLTVDAAEKRQLATLAATCTNARLTVRRA